MRRDPNRTTWLLRAIVALLALLVAPAPSYAASEWTTPIAHAQQRENSSREIDARDGAPVESAIAPAALAIEHAKHSHEDAGAGRAPAWERLRHDPPVVTSAADGLTRCEPNVCPRRWRARLMVYLN